VFADCTNRAEAQIKAVPSKEQRHYGSADTGYGVGASAFLTHKNGPTFYISSRAGNSNGESHMSDNVTLFPNILQPATTLKAYAPIGVKFWENQESALKGWKEFADGWFARRQESAQAALEAAKHIGDANVSSDIFREYQSWFTRAMELLAVDGKAYQQQVLRVGAQLSARPEERQTG
jgi:hypothetical protein